MEIVPERLREDILETAAFGELDVETGYGRTVLTGSEADRAAREYFVKQLESAGLTVRIDPVGNIAGRKSWPINSLNDIANILRAKTGKRKAILRIRSLKSSTASVLLR